MDRNTVSLILPLSGALWSLSARRAWIEMALVQNWFIRSLVVALRKESVDRNIRVDKTQSPASVSLSARRAWIEMGFCRITPEK